MRLTLNLLAYLRIIVVSQSLVDWPIDHLYQLVAFIDSWHGFLFQFLQCDISRLRHYR